MSDKRHILAVDRNQRNLELLSQFLGKEGYETVSISSLEELAQVIENPNNTMLVLMDISGFDRSIWQYCEKFSDLGIPLLILSPKQSAALQEQSLAHGARGVLTKPLVLKEFLNLVRTLTED